MPRTCSPETIYPGALLAALPLILPSRTLRGKLSWESRREKGGVGNHDPSSSSVALSHCDSRQQETWNSPQRRVRLSLYEGKGFTSPTGVSLPLDSKRLFHEKFYPFRGIHAKPISSDVNGLIPR